VWGCVGEGGVSECVSVWECGGVEGGREERCE
jgi:hypothetical protein